MPFEKAQSFRKSYNARKKDQTKDVRWRKKLQDIQLSLSLLRNEKHLCVYE